MQAILNISIHPKQICCPTLLCHGIMLNIHCVCCNTVNCDRSIGVYKKKQLTINGTLFCFLIDPMRNICSDSDKVAIHFCSIKILDFIVSNIRYLWSQSIMEKEVFSFIEGMA